MTKNGKTLFGLYCMTTKIFKRPLYAAVDRLPTSRLITILTFALALSACVTNPIEHRDNVVLRDTIINAVPDSWRKAADSLEPVSPLVVTPDLRNFIRSSVKGNSSDQERMLRLTHAIFDREGMGLVYDPDATYTASEAFRSGTANCLGFSNLLVAAARELGLSAKYELVSHGLNWEKVDDVLVGTLHVRVVSYSGGRRMTFDFYPLPLSAGYSTRTLSDDEALAHHLNNLAAEALRERDHVRAFALLSEAIETNPGIAHIWSNLGILLSRRGLDSLAESAFKEALLISPETLSALSNLQRLYAAQGRQSEGREIMSKLEEYRERNPYHHAGLGGLAYEQGDYRDSIEHYKKAIDLKDNEPDFYVLISKSYDALGLDRAAQRAIAKAQSLDDPVATPLVPRPPKPKTGTRITRR